MEENKIVKYQGRQLQSISNKIIITNRILNDISTGVQMKLNKGKYVGNNEKNILIIIKKSGLGYIDDITQEQIKLILKPCKLELSDVAVFNIDKEKITIDDLIQMLSPKIILLFDIESNDIHFPLSLNLNEIQIYNGCEILLAVSLESLFKEEAKFKKRELWKNLKMIFNL